MATANLSDKVPTTRKAQIGTAGGDTFRPQETPPTDYRVLAHGRLVLTWD
jgi:hypothetical protein